jgi:hypothetical protein
MKKYYTTMSPDAAKHILLDTKSEALEEARTKVKEDGRTRYVVKILYKVEVEPTPVRVITVASNEE